MTKHAREYWQGKLVLVTGGSSGFGWFIARAFGRAGAKVCINGRDDNRLNDAVRRLAEDDVEAFPIAADVTQPEQVEQMFADIQQQHGKLDVLVNNAGSSDRGAVLETSVEEFRALLELNFLALVHCTQLAAPQLLANTGHLVNIGSLGAKTVSPYLGAYPASKFPVAAYSQQLRMELGPQGLHVLLVCPGPIALPEVSDRYQKLATEKHLPASAGKPGGGVHLRGIDPDKVAQRIVRGCEKRLPEIVVPGRARWLFAVSALWPSLGDWIIRKMTK